VAKLFKIDIRGAELVWNIRHLEHFQNREASVRDHVPGTNKMFIEHVLTTGPIFNDESRSAASADWLRAAVHRHLKTAAHAPKTQKRR